jgi:long-chain acyl-CoA synthetase
MRHVLTASSRSTSRQATPTADPAEGPVSIQLSFGPVVDAAGIEAHYRVSPFICEICVLGWPRGADGLAESLYAVVVPDRHVLRTRRIVNAGEIVRFEMDGRAVLLPPHERVRAYRVSMTPLPRTATGAIDRAAIHHTLTSQPPGPLAEEERAWLASGPAAPVVSALQRLGIEEARIRPDANLELDLGIDSLARVELLASLERGCGARVPDEVGQQIFTVRDLAAAVAQHRSGSPSEAADPWASILAADAGDPASALATADNDRIVWLFYVLARLVSFLSRVVIRYEVEGLEHLPRRGPYLICPNHESFIDPFVLAAHLPFRVVRQLFHVAATEYVESPLTAWAARQVRLLAVDPDSRLVPAMRAGAHGLRHGRVLVLFPEGERSVDGAVGRFKKGASILAAHLQVPVVPVALDGLFDLWPRNRPFAWGRLRPWRRHPVVIRVGRPLAPPDPRDACTRTYAAFATLLREAVVALRGERS